MANIHPGNTSTWVESTIRAGSPGFFQLRRDIPHIFRKHRKVFNSDPLKYIGEIKIQFSGRILSLIAFL